MTLLNVRVGVEEARMAAALRDAGVPISTLVRAAIRAEYLRRVAPGADGRRPSDAVRAILAAFPDAPDVQASKAEPRGREAMRRHVRAKLLRGRP